MEIKIKRNALIKEYVERELNKEKTTVRFLPTLTISQVTGSNEGVYLLNLKLMGIEKDDLDVTIQIKCEFLIEFEIPKNDLSREELGKNLCQKAYNEVIRKHLDYILEKIGVDGDLDTSIDSLKMK